MGEGIGLKQRAHGRAGGPGASKASVRQEIAALRDFNRALSVLVWTAPPWQELSELLQHWSGAVMCPACLCGGEAAGHNALRGSGPNQKHAFKDALTQTGSPDPRIDLVCITSS